MPTGPMPETEISKKVRCTDYPFKFLELFVKDGEFNPQQSKIHSVVRNGQRVIKVD